MLGHARDRGAGAVDVERRGPDGFTARRQVVCVGGRVWIVVDAFADVQRGRRVRTVWTTEYDVVIAPRSRGGDYSLRRAADAPWMAARWIVGAAATRRLVRGEREPFVGWVERDFEPTAAPALVVEVPSRAARPVVAVFVAREPRAASAAAAELAAWSGPDAWRVEVPVGGQILSVARDGGSITWSETGGSVGELVLDAPPGVVDPIGATEYAEAARRRGPRFRDRIDYRWRATWAVAGLVALCAVAVAFVRGAAKGKFAAASAVAVAALGWWLDGYLNTP